MVQVSTRTIVVCVAMTTVVTLYSLSELHSLSVAHAEQEKREEALVEHTGSSSSTSTTLPKHTVSAASAASRAAAAVGTHSSSLASKKQAGSSSGAGTSHKCFYYPHTEMWGDVVEWGNHNLVDSKESCCDLCRNHKPKNPEDSECNVFVWCGDKDACKEHYKECWLKHLAHPEATRPAKQGPHVAWTSGTLDVDLDADASSRPKSKDSDARRFHIVTTAQGSAVHWQARIHYYWYKKQKARCEKEGHCEMGGFTRLLHSGEPDDLVDEIPTMVVNPLPSDMVEHSWYVVLNRPYAFVQWVKKAKIPEKYVLMSEPDHVFLRPLPNFMNGETPAAFPFFYIEPAKKENQKVTMKFTGPLNKKQLEQLAPIGNSPTFMNMDDMTRTMPIWMNVSIAIFKDEEANRAWGWVQEMYGFTIAAWLAGVTKFDLFLNMMAQPPWDTNLNMTPSKPFYILHYTYGMDYKLTGEFTPGKIGEWRFDKRSYGGRPVPRHLGDPPKGMQNDLVRTLINSFNEATEAIPCWDEYAKSGKVPKTCSEEPKHFLADEAAAKKAAGSVDALARR